MFSKSCEYAIRAFIFIYAQQKNEQVMNIHEIAEAIGAPTYYTSKILQQLVRMNLLNSVKGPSGGFFVADRKQPVRLIDIVSAIDGDKIFNGCGLGLKICSEKKPCPIHDQFKSIRADILQMLEKTTLDSLADKLKSGKFSLKKL